MDKYWCHSVVFSTCNTPRGCDQTVGGMPTRPPSRSGEKQSQGIADRPTPQRALFQSTAALVSPSKMTFAEKQWTFLVAKQEELREHREKSQSIKQRLLSPWSKRTPDDPSTKSSSISSSSSLPSTSLAPSSPTWCNTLHRRGLCFVTMFSDEQQVRFRCVAAVVVR